MSNFVKKLPILLLFFCASPHTWADKDPDLDKTDREARNTLPYLRGEYSVGMNSFSGALKEMELNFGSSRSNGKEVCCYFPTRLSWLFAGFGIKITNSTWNFRKLLEFQKEGYDGKLSWKTLAQNDPYGLYKLLYQSFPKNKNVTSTSLSATWLELLFPEFRINTNRNAPEAGFWASLGGIIGMRWGRATQYVNYKQHGEDVQTTRSESFNLSDYRLGFTARVGWNGISIFYIQALTDLFKESMEPNGIRPWSIGVSISITSGTPS